MFLSKSCFDHEYATVRSSLTASFSSIIFAEIYISITLKTIRICIRSADYCVKIDGYAN